MKDGKTPRSLLAVRAASFACMLAATGVYIFTGSQHFLLSAVLWAGALALVNRDDVRDWWKD